MRISDWSSDVCSSDLQVGHGEKLATAVASAFSDILRSFAINLSASILGHFDLGVIAKFLAGSFVDVIKPDLDRFSSRSDRTGIACHIAGLLRSDLHDDADITLRALFHEFVEVAARESAA